ncbi:MAG: exo-alpha-sialidase [Clostridia bacterium]|nr:exo-alpha-sialidase [Clostridia bacterium]
MGEARVVLSFARDEKYCRHSEGDFIRMRDGGILLIYTRFKGKKAGDSAPADLVKRVSYDDGETWSDPEEVVTATSYGVQNVMSVSLIRLKDGDIGMIFISLNVPGYLNQIHFMRSSDEGKTFRHISLCTPREFTGRFGVNNARLVRLSSGRIVFPLSIHPGEAKSKCTDSNGRRDAGYFSMSDELGYIVWSRSPHLEGRRTSRQTLGAFMYSDDEGYTWQRSSDIVCPPFTSTIKGLQEGELIEIRPGVLKCFWRTDRMNQYEAVSFDGADHWTTPQMSCFTAPWSPITIERNPFSGKIYAIWNPVPQYNGKDQISGLKDRTPFAIAQTNDDVSSFGDIHLIEDDPDHAYSYAATLFLSETELLLSYTAGGTEDRHGHSRMNISKIKIPEYNTEVV